MLSQPSPLPAPDQQNPRMGGITTATSKRDSTHQQKTTTDKDDDEEKLREKMERVVDKEDEVEEMDENGGWMSSCFS